MTDDKGQAGSKFRDDIAEVTKSFGLPVGITAITGVLIALGVQGETLARLLRNRPTELIIAFVCALTAVAIAFLAAALDQPRQKKALVGAGVLLAVAAALTAWAAISGAGDREQPTLSLTAQPPGDDSDQQITVIVKADGLSLKSEERMILRVLSLSADPRQVGTSGQGDSPTPQFRDGFNICASTGERLFPANATLLYLGEGGPDSTGKSSISVSFKVDVPSDDGSGRYVCAHAALTPRSEGPKPDGEQRFVTAMFDLMAATPGTQSTDSAGANAP